MKREPEHVYYQELLGVRAVNALELGELAELEQHLEECRGCRVEVAEHHEALAGLTAPLPAPPDSWAGIQAALEADNSPVSRVAREAEVAVPTPLRQKLEHRWLAVGAAAAAIAATVALTFVVLGNDGLGDPAFESRISPASAEIQISGQAQLFDPDAPGGVLVLDLTGVPPSPVGHHYQVWVLRSGGGGAMEAVGAFSPEKSDTHLELPLPGPGSYAAVDISVQEDGGAPDHSGVSIAGAGLS